MTLFRFRCKSCRILVRFRQNNIRFVADMMPNIDPTLIGPNGAILKEEKSHTIYERLTIPNIFPIE